MKRTILLACLALVTACGETSEGAGRTGTGGTGTGGNGGTGGTVEPPPPPQSVDATCRDWCANEAEGASCHQGPFESVQPCYESCLATYQQEVGRECEAEWIAIKDCQVDLDCADLFGDCDSVEDTYNDCVARAADRVYCADRCPDMDPNDCDRARCDANLYCESACPTEDRDQCIEERISDGQCVQHDAVNACRRYCAGQDLSECVSQWMTGGICQFDDGIAACEAYCPPQNLVHYVCVEHWDMYNQCPAFPELSTCTVLCIGECAIEGIDPSQGFDQCVTSCYDQQPYANDCMGEAERLDSCLDANGCGAAQTATCGDRAAALSDCLATGPPPEPTTCRSLCSGDCAIDVPLTPVPGAELGTIDPGLGLEACVSSCEQQFPNRNDGCVSVAENLNECLETNGCAAQTTTCGTIAEAVSGCLWGIFE